MLKKAEKFSGKRVSFVACFLLLLFIISGLNLHVLANDEASSETSSTSNNNISPKASVTEYAGPDLNWKQNYDGYGITRLSLDFFSFYERKGRAETTQGFGKKIEGFTTAWYGSSMDFDWRLPAEAREGDYFTLKVEDNSIFFNRAPMYADHEVVPYATLDQVENRYHGHQDNKFGVITTVGTDKDAPVFQY